MSRSRESLRRRLVNTMKRLFPKMPMPMVYAAARQTTTTAMKRNGSWEHKAAHSALNYIRHRVWKYTKAILREPEMYFWIKREWNDKARKQLVKYMEGGIKDEGN